MKAFPGAVGAEAVGVVADDLSVFEEEEAGVSGADVGHDGVTLLHRGGVAKAAAGFEEDEAGHFAIVEGLEAPPAGDLEPVEEDLGVGGFGEGVGGDGADGGVLESEFQEGVLEAFDDEDRLFDGGGLNRAMSKNIAPEGDVFFEEVDDFFRAIGGDGDDNHGSVAGSDVNRSAVGGR